MPTQELPWRNWEGATAALLPNLQPGLFNPLKNLAPGLYSKDIVSSPSYLAFFHGINLKYLQIVAGRFPLNKELAFELAALMAQVDHLIINLIITTTTAINIIIIVAINIIITTVIATCLPLSWPPSWLRFLSLMFTSPPSPISLAPITNHYHHLDYRLTWATLVLNAVAALRWETQIFRKLSRDSTQFAILLR